MDASLATLNKAIAMDPKNPLCKFHRASVYFSLENNQAALKDLEELKEIVPKESLVYFLIGKVCTINGIVFSSFFPPYWLQFFLLYQEWS